MFLLTPCRSSLTGGLRPLLEDDFKKVNLRQTIQFAVKYFNEHEKDKTWYNIDHVFDAYEQVVAGTMYHFNLHLVPTKCSTDEVLATNKEDLGAGCQPITGQSTVHCSFQIWQKLKEQGSDRTFEKKSMKCWRLGATLPPMQRTARFTDPDEQFKKDVMIAVNSKLMQGNISKVESFVEYLEVADSDSPSNEKSWILYLDTTECKKPLTLANLAAVEAKPCYNKINERQHCDLRLTKVGTGYAFADAVVANCVQIPVLTGMWRSTFSNDKGSVKFGSSESDRFEIKRIPLLVTRMIADVDELKCPFVKANLIQSTIRQYNQMVNSIFYSTGIVEKNSVERSLNHDTTSFKMRFQPTKLLKNKISLEKFMNKSKNEITLEPIGDQICDIHHRGAMSRNPRVEISNCVADNVPRVPLMGAPTPVAGKDLTDPGVQAVFKEIAEQFSKKIGKVGETWIGKSMSDVHTQVTSGITYTAKMSFQLSRCATSECKNEACYACSIKAHKPASPPRETNVNFTDCVKMKPLEPPPMAVWEFDGFQRSLLDKAIETVNKASNPPLNYTKGSIIRGQTLIGDVNITQFRLDLEDSPMSHKVKQCYLTAVGSSSETAKLYIDRCSDVVKDRQLPPMLGAPTKMDESTVLDRGFLQLVKKAAETHNTKAAEHFVPRHVTLPKTQIVSGSLTKFELHSQKTECTPGVDDEHINSGRVQLCGPVNNSMMEVCKVSIHKQPWLGEPKFSVELCKQKAMLALPVLSDEMVDIRTIRAFLLEKAVRRAVVAFNVKSADHGKHYFDKFIVEKIRERDRGNTTTYSFTLTLRQTDCKKGQHDQLFYAGKLAACDAPGTDRLVTCNVTVDQTIESEKVTFNKCKELLPIAGEKGLSKPKFIVKKTGKCPEFEKITKMALNLLDQTLDASVTHSIFRIDRPKQQTGLGTVLSFDLYVRPSGCQVRNMSRDQKPFNKAIKLYSVYCHVKVWYPPWPNQPDTMEISNCTGTKSKDVRARLDSIGNAASVSSLTNLQPKFIRLVDLFNSQSPEMGKYQLNAVQNVTKHNVPGEMVTLDLLMNPKSPGPRKPMYHCKASIWSHPGSHDTDVLDLNECRSIVKSTDNSSDEVVDLSQLKTKVADAFNNMTDDGFFYVIHSLTENNASESTATMVWEYSVSLEPTACKKDAKKKCGSLNRNSRYYCTAERTKWPWHQGREQIRVHSCFLSGTTLSSLTPGTTPLSQDEQMSPTFRSTVNRLVNLYDQGSGAVYEAQKIENGTVTTTDEGRTISFSMTLAAVGCEQTPATSGKCSDWKSWSQVKCLAKLIQTHKPVAGKEFFLRKCERIWEPSPKRELSTDEMVASEAWRSLIQRGVKMYANMTAENELFTLRKIEKATLEQTRQKKEVEIELELVKTNCTKADFDKLFNNEHNVCQQTVPKITTECEFSISESSDGQKKFSMRCDAPEEDD